jgi:two-component system, CitB family, response regulator
MSHEEIKVLVIEDDPKIAEINRRYVEKVPGYQVIGIALEEEEARDQLSILEPDLVLLDIYFPNFSGLDFLTHIQQNHPHTDVIMITAAKDIETVRTAIKTGAYDFIIKPILFQRLKETLVKYQEFRRNLSHLKKQKQQIDQEDIDQLLKGIGKKKASDSLPKGIDKLTLEKVLKLVRGGEKGLTAEESGKAIGISRTTARRYLEYLYSIDKITADLVYGEIGRPERVYRPRNN